MSISTALPKSLAICRERRGSMSDIYTEYRQDGWPLCPQCGEDELFSHIMIAAVGKEPRPAIQDCIDGEMTCYFCSWNSWRERLNQPKWPEEINA